MKVFNTIAELRATKVSKLIPGIQVLGYYSRGDGGGGEYQVDASDTTSVDNSGSVLVINGVRVKAVFEGPVVNIRRFGAVGDGVTNDQPFIQAAIDYIKSLLVAGELYIPSGIYKLNTFLDLISPASVGESYCRINIRGAGSRTTILNPSGNFPGLIIGATYQSFRGFRVDYLTQKIYGVDDDSYAIVCVAPAFNGIYGTFWSTFEDILLVRGVIGLYNSQGVDRTVSVSALSGATSVTVSDATSSIGSFICSVVGAGQYIQITQDDATVLTTQVISRVGNVLTLKNALTANVTSGNSLIVNSSQFFSNSVTSLICYFNTGIGILLAGGGTGSVWNNTYIANGSQQVTWGDCQYGLYATVHQQNIFNQLNIEASNIAVAALFFQDCGGTIINTLHTEGCKFQTTFGSLVRCGGGPLIINGWQVYSTETVGEIVFGLIRVNNWGFGEITPSPADVTVNGIMVLGSKFDPLTTLAWVISDDTATVLSSVRIKNLTYRPNAGFPRQTIGGSLVAPSSQVSVLKELGNFIPENTDGAILGHAVSYNNNGKIAIHNQNLKLGHVTFKNSTDSLTTAKVGMYSVISGSKGSGIEYFPPTSLNKLTGYNSYFDRTIPETLPPPNSGIPFLYLFTTGTQALIPVFSTGVVINYQRLLNSSVNRSLNRWTYSGANHGVSDRDFILITGITGIGRPTGLNGQHEVVYVESNTGFLTYRWTNYTGAVNDTGFSQSGISISRYPMVDAFIYTDRPQLQTTFKTVATLRSDNDYIDGRIVYISTGNNDPARGLFQFYSGITGADNATGIIVPTALTSSGYGRYVRES